MFYIVFAVALFIASVITHIFFCRRVVKTGLHAKAFIFTAIIFFGVYALSVLALWHSPVLDPRSLWGLPFRITAGLIFLLLVPVYLCFYVLTQLTSPSKKILLSISQRGALSRADILAGIQEEHFIMTRLNDLCASGCVARTNDKHSLTSEGQKIAAILNLMQSILGRNVGG